MDQHLYKYLVLHKQLYLPGIGFFSVEKVPARYEDMTGFLHAPKQSIRFSEQVPDSVSQKPLFDFLARELSVDEESAWKQFRDFVAQLQNDLSANRSITLDGLGELSRDEDGTLGLEKTHDPAELAPPVKQGEELVLVLKNTETDNEEEEDAAEEKKDHWWIYALVLLMLGAGALLFYYN